MAPANSAARVSVWRADRDRMTDAFSLGSDRDRHNYVSSSATAMNQSPAASASV
jgi:hypothetical protein